MMLRCPKLPTPKQVIFAFYRISDQLLQVATCQRISWSAEFLQGAVRGRVA